MRVMDASRMTGLSVAEVARLVVTGVLGATVTGSGTPNLNTVDVVDADVRRWVAERDKRVRSVFDQMEASRILSRRFSARNWPPREVSPDRSHADQVLTVVASVDGGCSTGTLGQRLRGKWVSAAMIHAAVDVLVSEGLVMRESRRPSGRGRPSVWLTATEVGVSRVRGWVSPRRAGDGRARARRVDNDPPESS